MKTVRAAIQRAWCVELDREVSITEARREYLSLEHRPDGFTFYCHDLACRQAEKPVLVSGVNYRQPAEESAKYRKAHFRAHPKHPHYDACAWITGEVEAFQEEEDVERTSTKKARRKSTDLVTVFDPRLRSANPGTGTQAAHSLAALNSGSDRASTRSERPSDSGTAGEIRTSDLDELVDSYLEAKSTLSKEDFGALRLKIVGHGEIRYKDYFQWIGKTDCSGITYGGIRKIKDYKEGFCLYFHDGIKDQPVQLYVSATQLLKYRHWRYLRSIVDTVQANVRECYIQVFALGGLEYSDRHKCWNLVVDDLSHLTLILKSKTPRDATFL